ncbi:hypothetical protein [Streptomyces sp. A012304]|nr:hypothetical protein [Streptomyces sp. A012304]
MSRPRTRRPRRGEMPWTTTVLGAAVSGTVRAVVTWLLDHFSR